MFNGESLEMKNGLQVRVDWLSFTIKVPFSVLDVMTFMGYQVDDFQLLPRGAQGYRTCHRLKSQSVSILSEGREDMGIHVDIGGASIADVLQHFREARSSETPFGDLAYSTEDFCGTVLLDFLRSVSEFGNFTRIDLAIDDLGCNFYTIPDLISILDDGRFSSRFKKWRTFCERKCNGAKMGETLYLGDRSSDIMLRVYDKVLEQLGDSFAFGFKWVRWELELKSDRAEETVKHLLSGMSVGSVCIGILSNYFRIVELDKSRLCRCSTDPLWQRFIDGIEKLTLYSAPDPKTVDDTKRWLLQQIAPSLALAVGADGGDMSFIYRLIDSGEQRMNSRQRALVAQCMEV